MKKYHTKKILILSMLAALNNFPIHAIASDFNLPFVNAAGLGNMYAGWAAEADDASTAFTNPAGLIRISQQQLVLAVVGVTGNTEFTGTTTGNYPPPTVIQAGAASSKIGAMVPSFYYALPLTSNVVLGFGETVPFGLGTNYSKDSVVRYAATKTQITVIDAGPSIGFKITNKLSAGFGLDVDYASLVLNYMVKMGNPVTVPDAEVQNTVSDWGFGYHAGLLYQFTPETRAGLSYNSPVTFHANGDSTLYSSSGVFKSTNLHANMSLPALAQLSLYHDINSRWAIMGTVFYSDWHVLQQVILQNVAIPPAATMNVTLPFHYHNTFDYAAGVNFKVNPQWILRAGMGLSQAPSNNQDRMVSDPDSGATMVGIGAHYQQNRCLGYDIGYTHSFFKQASINHASAVATETGHSNSYTNVFGAQLTWGFA